MKTITRTIELYEFHELSDKAKQKAIEKYSNDEEYLFLRESLLDCLIYELEKLGFEHADIKIYYSLSYSRGDGLMFEGTVTDKDGNEYTIKQQGHYYHERSTSIEGENVDGDDIETDDFEENVYIPLCKKIRDIGYNEIEYKQSEEYMQEICEANDYTFTIDGIMENE